MNEAPPCIHKYRRSGFQNNIFIMLAPPAHVNCQVSCFQIRFVVTNYEHQGYLLIKIQL